MDEAAIAQREAQLRKQSPKMFTHPGAQAGEVYMNLVVEDAIIDLGDYIRQGLSTDRAGERQSVEGSPFLHIPIFVNLRELIINEDRLLSEKRRKIKASKSAKSG